MIWNILIKTMKMHMNQGETSGGNNLSERPAEISIPSFLAGLHPPGEITHPRHVLQGHLLHVLCFGVWV